MTCKMPPTKLHYSEKKVKPLLKAKTMPELGSLSIDATRPYAKLLK